MAEPARLRGNPESASRRSRTYIFIEKRDESRSPGTSRGSARTGELLAHALGEITSRPEAIASFDFGSLKRPKFAHHGPKSLPCHSGWCWERACSVAGQRLH